MFATSVRISSLKYRGAIAAAVAFGAALLPVTQAGAVGAKVRYACASDYLANCSNFAPNSPETRRCMRKVGYRLSKGCINALIDAGEVSQGEVARRSADRR